MAGKFEITTRKNGDFQFNLKASNGQVILTSQGYKTKKACLNGVDSVRKNATNDDRFELKESSSGQPFFTLKAANGQVIGSSQMYSSTSSRANGIASVKSNAPDAKLAE